MLTVVNRRPVIRAAQSVDFKDIVRIERAAFAADFQGVFLNSRWRSKTKTLILSPSEGEAPVAFVSLYLIGDEAHILSIATHPSVQRLGYARELLQRALVIVSDGGLRYLFLEVRRSNTIALKLYRDLGFEVAGIKPGYYVEEMEDALMMVRSLRAAGAKGDEAP